VNPVRPRLVLVNGMPGVGKSTLADRFASAAESAGADLVHVLLDGPVVEARVPDAALPHLVSYAHGLADLVSHPPRPHRVASRPGDVGATLAELEDLLGRDGPRLT